MWHHLPPSGRIWAVYTPEKLTCPLKINGWFRCISYWWNHPFLGGHSFVFRGVIMCNLLWFIWQLMRSSHLFRINTLPKGAQRGVDTKIEFGGWTKPIWKVCCASRIGSFFTPTFGTKKFQKNGWNHLEIHRAKLSKLPHAWIFPTSPQPLTGHWNLIRFDTGRNKE